MLVLEYKAKVKRSQVGPIDNAIRSASFVRNKCLREWMDGEKVGKYDLYKFSTQLRKEYEWCRQLNSTAVQASVERAWYSISRFYDRHKKGIRPVGYPKFRPQRSVEYKNSGWKLDTYEKRISFTDGNGIGTLKLKGTWDLVSYSEDLIKRVRIVKRADGYYVQFVVAVDRAVDLPPTNKTVGIDVGLTSWYTDSNGNKVSSPKFYRTAESKLKKLQRRVSLKKRGSNNRRKAANVLARAHLRVSRQRKDHAVQEARCVIEANDLVVCEDLNVRNLVRNRHLAKSIQDAGWSIFRQWLKYYAEVYGRVYVEVNPAYTSQACSDCGNIVKKSLSERTHACMCGALLDRDENAAINILKLGLQQLGRGTPEVTLAETEASASGGEIPLDVSAVAEARIPRL